MSSTAALADHLLSLFANPPSGLYVAPNIPGKKLAGAQTYAPLGSEPVLLLFDNTVFGSAKDGAVFTATSLYVHTLKQQRIDLAWIRSMPRWDISDGDLATPYGTLKVPKMLNELDDAFRRALEVVIGWNTGALSGPVGAPPVPGPIGEIAKQTLSGSKLDMGGGASRRKIMNAAAATPNWIDTLGGERIVAYGDETVMGKGDDYLVLTDRRLIARNYGDVFDLPYSEMMTAREEKGKLLFDHPSGPKKWQLGLLADQGPAIGAFLQGVTQLPPNQRWAPPHAGPTAEDPTGADSLLRSLPVPDPRLPILLRLVQAGVAARAISVEAGRDHVERVRLFAANAATGRGVYNGARVSPLHGDDLAVVLGEALGTPLGTSGDAATRVHDYRLTQKGSAGRAAASTVVGLAALAIVGVGWVSRPGVTNMLVRVAMRHLGSATGFDAYSLSGSIQPLVTANSEVFAGVLETIADAEPVVLLGRILWGWHMPAPQLLAMPPQGFAHDVGARIGWTDVGPFFTKTE